MIYDNEIIRNGFKNNKAIHSARLIVSSQEDIKDVEKHENSRRNTHISD